MAAMTPEEHAAYIVSLQEKFDSNEELTRHESVMLLNEAIAEGRADEFRAALARRAKMAVRQNRS